MFNILRRNIEETEETNNELKKCNFSPETPRCPIFKIGDIIKYADADFAEIGSLGGKFLNFLMVYIVQLNETFYFQRCDSDPIKLGL